MNKLILDNKDFKKMPYASTTVAWTKRREVQEKGMDRYAFLGK